MKHDPKVVCKALILLLPQYVHVCILLWRERKQATLDPARPYFVCEVSLFFGGSTRSTITFGNHTMGKFFFLGGCNLKKDSWTSIIALDDNWVWYVYPCVTVSSGSFLCEGSLIISIPLRNPPLWVCRQCSSCAQGGIAHQKKDRNK